jgi:mannose-6-phosphate isomerase
MPGHETVVEEGPYKGATLNAIVEQFPEEILGKKVYAKFGAKFPLLVKFIDSSDDLSIQVHPNDEMARRRHNASGKTEMWYSLLPEEGAYLYAGFNRSMDATTLRTKIADNTLVDTLGKFYVKPGDLFYLPSGRIHSIGKGNFIVEIQQPCDITYRIYDYDRRDNDGNPRELHVEEAVEAIDFEDNLQEIQNIIPNKGQRELLKECEFFTTSVIDVDKMTELDLSQLDSFSILIGIKGTLTVTASDGTTMSLPQGQTLLIPACIKSVKISGQGQLLTTNL